MIFAFDYITHQQFFDMGYQHACDVIVPWTIVGCILVLVIGFVIGIWMGR